MKLIASLIGAAALAALSLSAHAQAAINPTQMNNTRFIFEILRIPSPIRKGEQRNSPPHLDAPRSSNASRKSPLTWPGTMTR